EFFGELAEAMNRPQLFGAAGAGEEDDFAAQVRKVALREVVPVEDRRLACRDRRGRLSSTGEFQIPFDYVLCWIYAHMTIREPCRGLLTNELAIESDAL